MFALAGVIAFPDDRRTVAVFGQMAVKTVRREVQCAVFKPFNRNIARFERGVFNLLIRLNPVEDFALFAPERVRIVSEAFSFRN